MLYIFCPLYAEAKPLIESMRMKPMKTVFGHRCFANNEICLLICGTGVLYTAAFAAAVLSRGRNIQGMIVYGSGAMLRPLNKDYVYVTDQITNMADGRTYYPDVFLSLPTAPIHFVSGESLYTGQKLDGSVYDMESAGLYMAGSMFLRPDQMLFMRFISDHGEPGTISAAKLTALSAQHLQQAQSYISAFYHLLQEEKNQENTTDILAENIPISVTMRHQAMQMIRYARKMHIPITDLEERLYRINNKEEGKKILHELCTRVSR